MIAKSEEEIKNLRIAGKLLAGVLHDTAALVKDGVSGAELDLAAERMIRARGATPAFLGYKPEGAAQPYPAALCVSLNEEITHGLPVADKILRTGDIVSLDSGLSYKGFFVDAAVTLCVGVCDLKAQKLLDATREALATAIKAARVGGRVGDIGAAVARTARKYDFAVVKELGGHSLGRAVHEKPFVPNEGTEGEGETLAEGLVLALEPMFAEGKGAIVLDGDGWTYRTRDDSRSATFEHTILLTKNGPEILTIL